MAAAMLSHQFHAQATTQGIEAPREHQTHLGVNRSAGSSQADQGIRLLLAEHDDSARLPLRV